MLGWQPSTTSEPVAAVFMTYFAFLFLVPRWWRQGESTRNGRLSVWTVIVCVFWAWLLHFFWWFPQPTGMMVAGGDRHLDATGQPLDAAQPATGAGGEIRTDGVGLVT